MGDFVIKKNKHYSSGESLLSKVKIHGGITSYAAYFKFRTNCLYNSSKKGWGFSNKLCGFSLGYHHKSSIRIGWSVKDNKIIIYPYMYSEGIRYDQKFNDVSINVEKEYYCRIDINNNHLVTIAIYEVNQFAGPDNLVASWLECFVSNRKFGYFLWPYFGGRKRTPQEMNIELKQYKIR